ncbi:MAG: hypothetical protein J5965_16715 [Aeriscardovia sp.]|nr:hypothetical protein [Aeriscardovia sp.]
MIEMICEQEGQMARKNEKSKDTKLLQVYVEPELHRALGQYCLDNDTKNAPVVRELLSRFLEEKGYYSKRGNK